VAAPLKQASVVDDDDDDTVFVAWEFPQTGRPQASVYRVKLFD